MTNQTVKDNLTAKKIDRYLTKTRSLMATEKGKRKLEKILREKWGL